MTCKDFQRRWNELLDAEATATEEPRDVATLEEAEAVLRTHAADCPACRSIMARYQALRLAIRAWRRPPAPPADLVQRVLSVPDEVSAGTGRFADRRAHWFRSDRRDRVRWLVGLAAIGLISLGLGLLLNQIDRRWPDAGLHPVSWDPAGDLHSVEASQKLPKGPPALDRALAEAGSATWDLARAASEPAARIGREMLEAAEPSGDRPTDSPAAAPTEPGSGLASLSIPVPSLDPLGADAAGASAVLQQVGDHLSAGVRPLSSTARHAFGFLLGPTPARAGSPPGASTSNGARSG